MNTEQILIENSEIFSVQNNFFLYIIRFVFWWVIKGLAVMVNGVQGVLEVFIENMDFWGTAEVGIAGQSGGLYKQLMPVFWAILTVTIIITGLKLILRKVNQPSNIPTNLLMVIILVVGMPFIFSTLSNITKIASQSLLGETTMAESIIRNNTTDLLYVDKNNFSQESKNNKNEFSTSVSAWKMIDPVEMILPKDTQQIDAFKSKLVYESDGTAKVIKNSTSGMFGSEMFATLYYRYQINWGLVFVTLFFMLIGISFLTIQVGMNIWNLAFNGIFMMLVAAADIETGQRIKKIVDDTINLFLVIVASIFSLKLYIMGMDFAVNTFSSTAASLMMQIACTAAMIAGPGIVSITMNKDAGIGKSLQGAMSGLFIANGAAQALKGAAGFAGSIVSTAGKVASKGGVAAAAAAGGVSAGIKNAVDANKKAPASMGDFSVLGKDRKNNPSAATGNIGGAEPPPQLGSGGSSDADISGGSAPPDTPPDAQSDIGAANSSNQGGADTQNEQDTPVSQTGHNSENEQPASPNPASAGSSPMSNQNKVTKEDTIGSALGKLAGNTRPARAANAYGDTLKTAFSVGQNSMNKAWDEAKSAPKPIPYVHAEQVDSPQAKKKQSEKSEPIIMEPPTNTLVKKSTPHRDNKR